MQVERAIYAGKPGLKTAIRKALDRLPYKVRNEIEHFQVWITDGRQRLDDLLEQHETEVRAAFRPVIQLLPPKVRLYRGEETTEDRAAPRFFLSWTDERSEAEAFAGKIEHGFLRSADVPRTQILAVIEHGKGLEFLVRADFQKDRRAGAATLWMVPIHVIERERFRFLPGTALKRQTEMALRKHRVKFTWKPRRDNDVDYWSGHAPQPDHGIFFFRTTPKIARALYAIGLPVEAWDETIDFGAPAAPVERLPLSLPELGVRLSLGVDRVTVDVNQRRYTWVIPTNGRVYVEDVHDLATGRRIDPPEDKKERAKALKKMRAVYNEDDPQRQQELAADRASPVERMAIAGRASPWNATLTPDHFELPTVQQAERIAARARQDGEKLGRGNFGQAYKVPDPDAPGGYVLVKLPAKKDMHGREWNLGELRSWFIHEAGVANELSEFTSVVPHTVYVEVKGRPALVREYGELVENKLTVPEFDALAEELARIAARHWKISDDLLVARRPDGSLFIADVGVWFPVDLADRSVWERRMKIREIWEDLWLELHKLAVQQPWARPGDRDQRHKLSPPSLAELAHLKADVDEAQAELDAVLPYPISPDADEFERSLQARRLRSAKERLKTRQERRVLLEQAMRQVVPTPHTPRVWSRSYETQARWEQEWRARLADGEDSNTWTTIARGFPCIPRDGWPLARALRIVQGKATLADTMYGECSIKSGVGEWWFLLGQDGATRAEAESFAGSEDDFARPENVRDLADREPLIYATLPVVLIADRPPDWHPDDNPSFGLMGNSRIDPEIWPKVRLREVRYYTGKTWVSLPTDMWVSTQRSSP